jgi:nicotinate-nucleotide pyrophosphorylase (carboxylating)
MTIEFTDVERVAAKPLLTVSLREDLGREGDITTQAFLPPDARGTVNIVSRQAGVVAGLPLAETVWQLLDPSVQVRRLIEDGNPVSPGSVIAEVSGKIIILLAGERAALNFMTHLSGIASLTAKFVAAAAGTKAGIYDTRKTLPGWRILAKYAVRAGGGRNHRIGLFDAVLIKDNHLAAWKAANSTNTVAQAVTVARGKVAPGIVVEVEVDTLDQLQDALSASPDIILLDNMGPDLLRQAVTLRDAVARDVQLEASGGINLNNVAEIAATGIERISIGALTHSAPALDIGLDWLA